MAERKAVNKYYPPDWDPSKGSINTFVGQHPLRDRARKLSDGILIVRFELPFNIWCSGCERHLARGVRFNAEKKQIGKYYSTPILSFRMKCPSCSNWIEIHTDPKNAEYLVVGGGRKKIETRIIGVDEAAEDGIMLKLTGVEKERLASNPFAKLENETRDQRRAQQQLPRLKSLQAAKDSVYRNDWEASKLARTVFRHEKRAYQEQVSIADDIRKRGGMSLKLLPEHPDDIETAKSVEYRKAGMERADAHDLRKQLQSGPFGSGKRLKK